MPDAETETSKKTLEDLDRELQEKYSEYMAKFKRRNALAERLRPKRVPPAPGRARGLKAHVLTLAQALYPDTLTVDVAHQAALKKWPAVTPKQISAALSRLVADGMLERCDRGQYKHKGNNHGNDEDLL